MPLHPKTPSSLASFKSRTVLSFWYRITQVVMEKEAVKWLSSSSSSKSTEKKLPLWSRMYAHTDGRTGWRRNASSGPKEGRSRHKKSVSQDRTGVADWWCSLTQQIMQGFRHSVVVTEILLFLHLRLVQSRVISRLVPLEEPALKNSTACQFISTAILQQITTTAVVKVDTTLLLYFAFALVHDSRGIEIVNFTTAAALSAGTLMASASTPYRLVPAHFYPCTTVTST